MKKSKKDTAKDGGIQLGLFSVEASHANHTAQQESDSERKMLDISGRRCLGSYANAHPTRLWAKMFLESLVGTGAWSSKRCKLTWKLKGSKYKRLWFQLVPSALPTEGIGFGLLRTPSVQEPGVSVDRLVTKEGEPAKIGERCYDKHNGRLAQVGLIQQVQMGLLPTPIQNDAEKRGKVTLNGNDGLAAYASNGLLPTPDCQNHRDGTKLRKDNNMEDGGSHGVFLHHLGAHGILPTPMASDCGDKVTGKETQDSLVKRAREISGQTSQLSGRFVLEMMGFPPDWVESAYLALENESQNPD